MQCFPTCGFVTSLAHRQGLATAEQLATGFTLNEITIAKNKYENLGPHTFSKPPAIHKSNNVYTKPDKSENAT